MINRILKYLDYMTVIMPLFLMLFISWLMLICFYDWFLWAFMGGEKQFINWFENSKGWAKSAYVIFISLFVIFSVKYSVKESK